MILPTPSPLNMKFRIDAEHGIADHIDKRRFKVALTGATPLNRLAPLHNEKWEVWGINRILRHHVDNNNQFRADRWFEMHPMTIPPQDAKDMEWIRECPHPLYTLEWEKELPLSLRFPIERVAQGRELFSCTFCYQVALAISEGFEEIGLYGIELAEGSPRERTLERACLLWWLGFAEGNGLKVTVPDDSELLVHHKRYGYDYKGEDDYCRDYLTMVAHQMKSWKVIID